MRILYIVLLVLALALAFSLMVASDREAQRFADCIISTAKAQGYAGNVYSREAWDTFSPKCK